MSHGCGEPGAEILDLMHCLFSFRSPRSLVGCLRGGVPIFVVDTELFMSAQLQGEGMMSHLTKCMGRAYLMDTLCFAIAIPS